MALSSGTRIAGYEILSAIGAGGMGEVYRARDRKLNRDVAIKVMPDSLTADSLAFTRFQTEAQAVAALSHPNILSIFDFGIEHGIPYAVMELLEGRTLRDALAGGALPVRKAIEHAIQIASGLAAAHAHGITHRDLKPENVFVTREGRLKILDFGLARVAGIAAAGGVSAQATASPTTPGTVLGTVGYMSPEQVRGQIADHRSDIFAFGAVLYEMLAGQRAFSGPSAVETMNAILREEPPELTRIHTAFPPSLDRIVRRCLEKNPDERFQSARDLGFALEALSGPGNSAPAIVLPPARPSRWAQALGVVAFVAVAVSGFLVGRSTSHVADVANISFETKTFQPQVIFNARFMPDGETIVYSTALEGNSPELWVSRPGQIAPQPLGARGLHLLAVSSKGELAVLTEATYIMQRLFQGTLARMPIDGAPRPWLENVREADWSPDGTTLAIVRDLGTKDLLEYPVGKPLYESPGYLSDLRVAPDGRRVAFFEHPARFDNRGWLKVAEAEAGVRTLAGEYWGLDGLGWMPDGSAILYSGAAEGEDYQIYAVDGSAATTSHAVFRSLSSLSLLDINTAGHWMVMRIDDFLGIRAKLPGTSEERDFSWLTNSVAPLMSKDGGLLVFTDQSRSAGANYAVAMRKTDGSPVIRLGEGMAVALSPDGTRVLANIFNPPATVLYPIGPGDTIRLQTDTLQHATAVGWFPDGKRIILCGNEPSRPFRCYEQAIAGGSPRPLTREGFGAGPIAPDGRTLVVIAADQTKQLLSLDDGTIRPVKGVTAQDTVVAWSDDGRSLFVHRVGMVPNWLERVNPETGRRELTRELGASDRSGLLAAAANVSLVNDARAYAYDYWRRFSRLSIVKGGALR